MFNPNEIECLFRFRPLSELFDFPDGHNQLNIHAMVEKQIPAVASNSEMFALTQRFAERLKSGEDIGYYDVEEMIVQCRTNINKYYFKRAGHSLREE